MLNLRQKIICELGLQARKFVEQIREAANRETSKIKCDADNEVNYPYKTRNSIVLPREASRTC